MTQGAVFVLVDYMFSIGYSHEVIQVANKSSFASVNHALVNGVIATRTEVYHAVIIFGRSSKGCRVIITVGQRCTVCFLQVHRWLVNNIRTAIFEYPAILVTRTFLSTRFQCGICSFVEIVHSFQSAEIIERT